MTLAEQKRQIMDTFPFMEVHTLMRKMSVYKDNSFPVQALRTTAEAHLDYCISVHASGKYRAYINSYSLVARMDGSLLSLSFEPYYVTSRHDQPLPESMQLIEHLIRHGKMPQSIKEVAQPKDLNF